MKIIISESVVVVKRVARVEVEIEPIRDMKTLLDLMVAGQKDFYHVYDMCKDVTRLTATGVPHYKPFKIGGGGWMFTATTHYEHGNYNSRCFLSDCNIEVGGGENTTGYNHNFIFATKETAELYVAHRTKTGQRLPQTGK